MDKKLRKLGLLFVLSGSMFLYSCGDKSKDNEESTDDTEVSSEDDMDVDDELTDDTEEISDADGWKTYTNEDGNFSVDFPGTPTENSQVTSTEVGDIKIHMFMYQPPGVEAIYMVGYNDMPAELMEAQDEAGLKSMLDGGIEGGLGALKTLDSHEPVIDKKETYKFYDKFQAIKVKAHNGKYYAYIKCFINGNRLYQIWKLKDGDYASESKVDKFFDSFKLLDQE